MKRLANAPLRMSARTRPGHVVAVLRRVRHRPALLGDPALVHQIDDQLELVQALEVRDLGLVTRVDQGLEACLDECGRAAAEHRLLTEQVGLGLLGEGRADPSGAQGTQCLGVGQGQRPGPSGGVLLDGDDDRDAAPGDVLAADQVPGTFGRDHAHVDAGRRADVAESDVEPVPEEQGVTVDQVGRDGLGVQVPLHGVRGKDHDQVGLLAGLERGDHPQAVVLGLGPAARALGQADPDVHPGVAQGLGVRVPLAAIAEDRDAAVLDGGEVGVVVVVHLGHGAGLLREWGERGQAVDRSSERSARSVIERLPRPSATRPD
jgi:hypothetical protein